MKTDKPHRMIKVVMALLLLLGVGTLADMYAHGGLRLFGAPFSFFLPGPSPDNERAAISPKGNAGVLKNVFDVFDPSLRSFLSSVPIVFDPSATTAKAYRRKGYIGVSPDWDNHVRQSKYSEIYEKRGMRPEDPVFSDRFKTDLLIHEFLHILQVHREIDGSMFYEAVARWYPNPRYGIPSPNGMAGSDRTKDGRPHTLKTNRVKYVLWHELYNNQRLREVPHDESWKDMRYSRRYRSSQKGVEEFAYIGQEILSAGSSSEHYIKTGQWCDEDWKSKKMRLSEISPEVREFFRGIFNPKLIE